MHARGHGAVDVRGETRHDGPDPTEHRLGREFLIQIVILDSVRCLDHGQLRGTAARPA